MLFFSSKNPWKLLAKNLCYFGHIVRLLLVFFSTFSAVCQSCNRIHIHEVSQCYFNIISDTILHCSRKSIKTPIATFQFSWKKCASSFFSFDRGLEKNQWTHLTGAKTVKINDLCIESCCGFILFGTKSIDFKTLTKK